MAIGKIAKLRRSRPNPSTGGNRRRARRAASPGSIRRLAQKIPGLTVPRLDWAFRKEIRGFRPPEWMYHARRLPRLRPADAGAGQIVVCLLARSAGVHVDFHAHLHLNDFRSLPRHWGPPTSVGAVLTPGLNVRRVREQRKCGTRQSSSSVADPTADTSLLDKNHFSLGQSTERYPNRSRT
jgi:hypothetical protein